MPTSALNDAMIQAQLRATQPQLYRTDAEKAVAASPKTDRFSADYGEPSAQKSKIDQPATIRERQAVSADMGGAQSASCPECGGKR